MTTLTMVTMKIPAARQALPLYQMRYTALCVERRSHQAQATIFALSAEVGALRPTTHRAAPPPVCQVVALRLPRQATLSEARLAKPRVKPPLR